MEYLTKEAMVPGKVENLFVIIDAHDVGITQIPKKKLEAIVGVMGNNYRGRLYRLFGINVGVMLRTLWAIVRMKIDQFTAEKISINGGVGKAESELKKYVKEEHREKKFGGKLDDKEEGFYPADLLI